MVYKIGWRTLTYLDKRRANWEGTGARPLRTDIWYPAVDSAEEADIFLGPPNAALFKAGRAAREAELFPAPFPLVLLSHGTGGAALQLGWLAGGLAAHGYLVAGVNHHGNNALEPYRVQAFLQPWERALYLSVVLNLLLDDKMFGPLINRQQIGAAGFSLGGYTVIALAGGVLDALQAVYQDTKRDLLQDMPPEFSDPATLVAQLKALLENDTNHKQSYQDRRIRCVFAIAPALGEAFTPAGLASIEIPVKIVVGEADSLAPATTNASRYACMIKQAELTILEGHVGHYTFLGEGTEVGKQAMPDLCLDAPGIDRAAIHQQVSSMAMEFFDNHLDVKQLQ
jgi:predicted dienelactone hydrolase